MQPSNRLRHLAHQPRRVLLRVRPLLDELLEELAARHQLHHEVPFVVRLEDVTKRDNIRVRAHLLQDGDLATDRAHVGAALLDRFDRDRLARFLVHAAAHRRKVAVAEHLHHLVHVGELQTVVVLGGGRDGVAVE